MHETDKPLISEITTREALTQDEWNALMRLVGVARSEDVAEIVYKSCRIKFHPPQKAGPIGRPNFQSTTGIR